MCPSCMCLETALQHLELPKYYRNDVHVENLIWHVGLALQPLECV